MPEWDLRPGELWEHLGGVKGEQGVRRRGGSGILIPMESSMLTANKADGLVLVVNYLRCG